jgi:cysteine desulfurase/selenocysteine lyase
MPLDTSSIRKDFPILGREIRPGIQLVYLDSTATTQKPLSVLKAIDDFYRYNNANIHRGVHTLAEEATAMYEHARQGVAKFIHASSSNEIVFTRNATEAINLVAYSWARTNLRTGDLVVLTEMEHHSNLVPWYQLAVERNIKLEYIPVTEEGLLDLEVFRLLLERNPKLVSFSAMSNVLGTINPTHELVKMAHKAGSLVLVDGAQSVPHLPVDVQALDLDFLAFSAHKMLGPTGIGVLYGKANLLEAMPPFLGGGDMIKTVHLGSFLPQ